MSSTKKPSENEDEFIAKQEAVERHRAAVEKAKQMASADREAQARQHHMKCPKCGFDLHATVFRGVTIDRCDHCNGSWLDAGELETLAGHGGDVLRRMAEIFRR